MNHLNKILTTPLISCSTCAEILIYQGTLEKPGYFHPVSKQAYCSPCRTTELNQQPLIKIKPCFACGDPFPDYGNNYDYCKDCSINNNHYIPGRLNENKCPECGDGSGWIKLGQEARIRACKLCVLNKQNKKGEEHE
jgi:hypothetical protein